MEQPLKRLHQLLRQAMRRPLRLAVTKVQHATLLIFATAKAAAATASEAVVAVRDRVTAVAAADAVPEVYLASVYWKAAIAA